MEKGKRRTGLCFKYRIKRNYYYEIFCVQEYIKQFQKEISCTFYCSKEKKKKVLINLCSFPPLHPPKQKERILSHYTRGRAQQTSRRGGIFLAVQWLRLCLPMQGVWVQSLVGELRSHTLQGQKTKT